MFVCPPSPSFRPPLNYNFISYSHLPPPHQRLHHLPHHLPHPRPPPPPRALRALLNALPKLLRRTAHALVRARELALRALAVPPLRGGGAERGLALHGGVDEARGGEALVRVREREVRGRERGHGAGRGRGAREEAEEGREEEEEEVPGEPEVVVPLFRVLSVVREPREGVGKMRTMDRCATQRYWQKEMHAPWRR